MISESRLGIREGRNLIVDSTPIVRIAAVGDLMLGSGVGMRMQKEGTSHPFRLVKPLMLNSDLRFGNLEYPLTESSRRHPAVRHVHRSAPPKAVESLIDAGFTLLSIANNHIFDYLDEGLANTVSLLTSHGIGSVGSGSCLSAARAPAVLQVNGIKVGFLGYTYPLHQIATEYTAGCALNHPDMMREDVRSLKGRCDHVIVSIHAGTEFFRYPSPYEQDTSRMLLDEGATAILYHHAHVPKGIEIYKGKLIAYGLGNFICDIHDNYFKSASSSFVDKGMVLYVDLDGSRLVSFELVPTVVSTDLAVRPATGLERQEFFDFMNACSTPLYDVKELEVLQPDRSWRAKIGRLATRARTKGMRALVTELSSDAITQVDRWTCEPIRIRALTRQLKSSQFSIKPNSDFNDGADDRKIARPRRILLLTQDLGGGTGNHVLSMLTHWDKSRWSVEIVSEAPQTARVASNVPIETLIPSRWYDNYPLTQIRRLAQVQRHIAKNPADLVHAYFFWPIIYGRILKQLGKIRFLVENREDEGFNWGRKEYALLRLTRTIPDRVICVSEAVRQVALERELLDPARTMVVHNGVEPVKDIAEEKSATRRGLGITKDNLVVGMVANFNRSVKGVSYFLDAIPSIVHAVPSARFLILGRGREEQALREKAKMLGIDSHLVFAGFRKEIAQYYSVMDISVMTSLSEGLSITLLESMSYGLPVVATRVGGNPEVVMDGITGYLVPPKDVPAFVERVVELLRNPDLRARMGQEARRRVERQFQIRNVAERYVAVYESLLEPKTCRYTSLSWNSR